MRGREDMVGREAEDLGRQLASLAATVRAQAEASAAAHRVHSERDDRLESKIDALLAQDRQLSERMASVETTLRDGLVVARELGGRAAASSSEAAERLRQIERNDAEQIGRADQRTEGVRQSIAFTGLILTLVGLGWLVFVYIKPS